MSAEVRRRYTKSQKMAAVIAAEFSIEQTADGWDVTIKHAEQVVVTTTGKEIGVDIVPDEDDAATPLDVKLQ